MDRNTMHNTEEITDFTDKFGEVFFDAIMEEDNSTYEMAKSIIAVLDSCETERDIEMADRMLIACCGYSFETLVNRIKEQDSNGYQWESC